MIELKDSSGQDNFVQEGESANITATFEFNGVQFNKAAILTLTLTLYDEDSSEIINSRDEEDILDDNGGLLATDGTLTLELDADDNVVVDDEAEKGATEKHVARLKWTWNDGDGERTGIEELAFYVQKLATPVGP